MNPSDKKSDSSSSSPWQQREPPESSVWGILLVGLVGATATTLMVGRLRRTVDWFYTQMNRSQSSRRNATGSSHRGGGSSREEARNAYNRRMQEEYEDEMERVERIRRVQSVFNRERNKHRSYESWRENDSSGHQYHQNFQRDDWYWKTNTSYKDKRHNDQRTNFRCTPRDNGNYSMLHHYSVLGLDRSRANTYSEAEIKSAFRIKAMEYHPDQNQNNKDAAEAKFKEVMISYEAIKVERKKGSC